MTRCAASLLIPTFSGLNPGGSCIWACALRRVCFARLAVSKGYDALVWTNHCGNLSVSIYNDNHPTVRDAIRPSFVTGRWLVEKSISEQIGFFHLNRISSSMVIKVDFDLTMSILAHNLLRLLAMDLPGYSHLSSQSLFDQFLHTGGSIDIGADTITVGLQKRKAESPGTADRVRTISEHGHFVVGQSKTYIPRRYALMTYARD